ncbi:MAG: glycosyltransferase family 4 protein [Lachnospiraceae bacterium]|nr:glycosyltransferase family 4 protein [Lachnospiraceae bacterium]
MKVLWLCNVMLPVITKEYGMEASNKEGWLSGLLDVTLENQKENKIQLAVAYPAGDALFQQGETVIKKEMQVGEGRILGYGFREDLTCPDRYDPSLEAALLQITEDFKPDVIHCFGTEYPHTLAMCKTYPNKERLLITIQGLCSVYADAYNADLPERVIARKTFRDVLKKDSIPEQREKFVKRGKMEIESISLAGNIGGRTPWDQYYAKKWNPTANYFVMRETLRKDFYDVRWEAEKCIPHSIFLSQGDYPIKGLHYMLLAMPKILKQYPDAHVYVAGNGITAFKTIKEKLKISSYGKYLRELMTEQELMEKVTYLGKLTAEEMKARYLQSSLFVCPSSIENSPNSLGEAMLLGMPCVTADVGGIPGIFDGGRDGIVYRGHRPKQDDFYRAVTDAGLSEGATGAAGEKQIADALAGAVLQIWSDPEKAREYCENARAHALRNHDRMENYRQTVAVYAQIAGEEAKENGAG